MTEHPVNSDPVLRLSGLEKQFGDHRVLRGIDLEVRRGEVVTIIGPSGSGKSTLLRCVNLLEVPERGEVWFGGKEYAQIARRGGVHVRANDDLRYLRTHMGIVFQQFNLFPHLTVLQNVSLAPIKVHGLAPAVAHERSLRQLEKVGLMDKIKQRPGTLSGGQQQRVAIARALVLEPTLMLFDEITSALDPELVGEVIAEIERLADSGMTMLVVTHEMEFARHSASRVVFMDEGVIVEQGAPSQVLSEPAQPRTREFLRRILA